VFAQEPKITIVPVDSGWAKNSINAVVFRKSSLTSWKDTQYISFYDANGYVVIGKRNHQNQNWNTVRTIFQGNVNDAHNAISIATDGEGYLHLSWDHHNSRLKYARSLEPGSMDFAVMQMTGRDEQRVTYPEFFRMQNGNLIFLYRSGESGAGGLIMNQYDVRTKTWTTIQDNLIDGEGQRNAYWQCYVDVRGTIHLSWVWRESADVASNHDLCYAKSADGGRTWTRSNGKSYSIPITASSAEYIVRIPEGSELINQTGMSADENGEPYVASYWREPKSVVPQYHVAYHTPKGWKTINLGFRKTPFSLKGQGTKSIPISRPQILVKGKGKSAEFFLVFRDLERANRVSVVRREIKDERNRVIDLAREDIGSWEPSYDLERWKSSQILNLFLQRVQQADGEGITTAKPELVRVLEWKP
jgi:hypothetical protein